MKHPEIFHIGMPKTGTTTIQRIMRMDERINYIRHRKYNTAEYWTTSDFGFIPGKVNIYSNENAALTVPNGGSLYCMLSRIKQCSPEAHIIITIREQRSMITSRYQYCIPYYDGFTLSFENWINSNQGMDHLSGALYGSLYKTIHAFFPAEQIHFLLFEQLAKDFPSFIMNFYSIFGLTPLNTETTVQRNRTLPKEELNRIFALNKFKIFRGGGYFSKAELNLYKKIAHKFPKSQGKEDLEWGKQNVFKEIEKNFAEENNLLIDLNAVSKEDLKNAGYLI